MSTKKIEAYIFKKWQTNCRYYYVTFEKDLLGDWVLLRSWGSKFNRRGNYKISVLRNKKEGELLIEKIAKTRRYHKYILKA